jgi:hypothetical protein
VENLNFLGMSISPQAEGVPQRLEIRGPGNTAAQRNETAHQKHETTGPGNSAGATRTERNTSHNRENTGIA